MSYKKVFGTPIWEFHIDDSVSDRLKLVEFCLEKEKSDLTKMDTNVYGSWISLDLMWDFDERGGEIFNPLNDTIRSLVNDAIIPTYEQLDKALKGKRLGRVHEEPHNININQSWVHVSRKHQHVLAHTHPGNWLSGVFYIKVPGDKDQSPWLFDPKGFTGQDDGWNDDRIQKGDLYFNSPNSAATHEHWPYAVRGNKIVKKPEEGKLVIWPSWLEHGVTSNQASTERIAYSFNISYLELKARMATNSKNIIYPHIPDIGKS
jgi:hypothetical protein